MPFPITDLATLTDLPEAQVNRETRVIVKATPTATKLDYITIDQMTNVIIGNKLTLSAPSIVTPGFGNCNAAGAAGTTHYKPSTLAAASPVSFTVDASWRPGFITGAQFVVTGAANVSIKCNTTNSRSSSSHRTCFSFFETNYFTGFNSNNDLAFTIS